MPRRSRRRPAPEPDDSFERFVSGWRRTEIKRGREWSVQPVSTARAEKSYSCPGCQGEIPSGTAHIVAWREDGVLGADADLAARRHWHQHCWRVH